LGLRHALPAGKLADFTGTVSTSEPHTIISPYPVRALTAVSIVSLRFGDFELIPREAPSDA
jgi:hypothetical protein